MRSCCAKELTVEAAVDINTASIDARGPDSAIISPHFETPGSMVQLRVDTERLKQEIIAELLPVLRSELRAEAQALVDGALTSRGCDVSVFLWGQTEDTAPRAPADTPSPATIKPVTRKAPDIIPPLNAAAAVHLLVAEGKMCPQGHPLRRYRTPADNWHCNKCAEKLSMSSTLFSCRACDYDECEKCYDGQVDEPAVIGHEQSMQARATFILDAGGRNLRSMVSSVNASQKNKFDGNGDFRLHSMCVSTLLELEILARPLGKCFRCFYVIVIVINILGMLAFASWGIVKINRPEKYAEVKHEMGPWKSGTGPLPLVAVSKPSWIQHAWNLSMEQCTILDGGHSGKVCNELHFLPCDYADWGGDWFCLPTDLAIQGTFGDPKYTYVAIDLIIPSGTEWEETGLSLNWEQKTSPFSKGTMSSLYTVRSGTPAKVEIFFQKVTAQVGSAFGFAGRMGNDESEDLLGQQVYLKRSHEYTRFVSMKENGRVLSIYLRADVFEWKDFYEVYSVLRMMESAGGLWTALTTIIAATFLAPAFLLVKYLRHRGQDNQI